jgi:hypothetical protein
MQMSFDSTTMLHGVKDVRIEDTPYQAGQDVKSSRDVLITLADGGTMKIFCFIEERLASQPVDKASDAKS